MAGSKYRADIDGLRALAVIPVILFHLHLSVFSGGYLGVDVFFVISGYLITTIIARELEEGKFGFVNFWTRRVRRIMPCLLVCCIVTLLVGGVFSYRPELYSMGWDAISSLGSFANIRLWQTNGSYWGGGAESSLFLHCWSLSVEEQFYLFYPIFLLLIIKFSRHVLKWMIVAFAASFAIYVYGVVYEPTAAFYLLPTRGWELLAGGILAIAELRGEGWLRYLSNNWVSCFGGVLIVCGYLTGGGDSEISYTVVYSVVGAVLIIAANQKSSWVSRLLSFKPTVYIGKLSYCAYLVHWPIIVFSRQFDGLVSMWLYLLLVGCCIIISTLLLHYLVEKPTRGIEKIYPMVAALSMVVVGLSIYLSYNVSKRKYPSGFDVVEFYGLYYDASAQVPPEPHSVTLKNEGAHVPARIFDPNGIKAERGILGGVEGVAKVVVLGDSHGSMWAKTIDLIANERRLAVEFHTCVATNPLFKISSSVEPVATNRFSGYQRKDFNMNVLERIASEEVKMVILCCQWSARSLDEFENFKGLLNFCQTNGVSVLVLNQPPGLDIGDNAAAQYLSYLGYRVKEGEAQFHVSRDYEKVKAANQYLEQTIKGFEGVKVFDVFSGFAGEFGYTNFCDGKLLFYYDDDHLSQQGTEHLKKKLSDAIWAQMLASEGL